MITLDEKARQICESRRKYFPPEAEPEIEVAESEEGDEPVATAAPADLTHLTIAEARQRHIDAEDDVELLEQWSEADDRKGIAEAIEERLAELAEGG